MTDLDLADLRRGVEQGWPIKNERVAQLLGLLDSATARIESLEAERDKAQRACRTLGKVVDDQARAALDATGLHHLVDETGDGDWGAVWENLAELGDCARKAEARLARVTDDSMLRMIRDELVQATIQTGCGADHETTVSRDDAAVMAEWVLALIRAVAADEQEADAVKYGTTPAERWLAADEQEADHA